MDLHALNSVFPWRAFAPPRRVRWPISRRRAILNQSVDWS